MNAADLSIFAVQVLLLLSVPGPTNTLLFMAGRERGFPRSLHLPVGEIAGYLLVIVPVATMFAPLLEENRGLMFAIKGFAAGWLLYLAYGLWRGGDETGKGAITLPRLFLTTLVNPKAVMLALVVFPKGDELTAHVAVFLAVLVPVALSWIALGCLAGGLSGNGNTRFFQRVAAGCLMFFSIALVLPIASS